MTLLGGGGFAFDTVNARSGRFGITVNMPPFGFGVAFVTVLRRAMTRLGAPMTFVGAPINLGGGCGTPMTRFGTPRAAFGASMTRGTLNGSTGGGGTGFGADGGGGTVNNGSTGNGGFGFAADGGGTTKITDNTGRPSVLIVRSFRSSNVVPPLAPAAKPMSAVNEPLSSVATTGKDVMATMRQ